MKIDISDLEMEERTIGLQRKPVADAPRPEANKVVEVEINSDITDLELQERTVGVQTKFVPTPAVKVKKTETSIKKNSGCCLAFLALGASALLSIWGISKII